MDLLQIFKALGDETRLRIINLLLQSGKELCVCEMTDALLVPQYQVSRHVAILRYIGLVKARKNGKFVYYGLPSKPTESIHDLLAVIKKHFASRYPEDLNRLDERLALRQGDVCVLGYAKSELSSQKDNSTNKKQ